jgi:hypothetical protein
MSGLPVSRFDMWLERVSKIAGILLPVVVAVVGGIYAANKDKSDQLSRVAQDKRDEYQRNWDNTQKQYANMTALVPLLTSHDPSAVATGLDIYASEASVGQAPLDLRPTIQRIQADQPSQANAAQVALDAAKNQMASACRWDPDGIYIQVVNNLEQLKNGRQLSRLLRDSGVPAVQGVQRVDNSPKATQLRYFFTDANKAEAARIKAELAKHGFQKIDEVDLSPKYLKRGCSPPGTFELWIGTRAAISADGTGTG